MYRRGTLVLHQIASILTGGFRARPHYPFTLSEQQWAKRLSTEAFAVLRQEKTERAFSSPLVREFGPGTYHCRGCDQPLFTAEAKFDAGRGWPSFAASLPGAVRTKPDTKLLTQRTEVHCSNCGSHLGHLYDCTLTPGGLRYCINGISLRFERA